MDQKESLAKLHLGTRVINVPLNKTLETQLLKYKESIIVDNTEMARFLRGYLPEGCRNVIVKIKDVEINFSIPAWLVDSLEQEIIADFPDEDYSDDFGQIVRMMIPADARPPSVKQLKYAHKIANVLDLKLTSKQFSSVISCGDFIDRHLSQFQEKQRSLQDVYTLSRKVARGYAALCLIYACGGMTAYVLKTLRVIRKETVERYLDDFRRFLPLFLSSERYFQDVSLSVINDFLENNYDNSIFPELNKKSISYFNEHPQALDIGLICIAKTIE